ncbi:hypothetical protein SIO17_20340 [Pseudoalteromonas piscicida]|uniref:hypothetical protein n=1 Tax=Pseudoalteromonas piscicida TaxID=43662 RepID=UPI0009DB9228|nr:hypothetical protein [Pseudoalteromonas piscicida]WPU31373.1 hypothetical protein SIO17_20340 [Pseudoalteromonas piscicida]
MLIKRCPLGSPECALFIVAQLLPRLLGDKSSVTTKTHSGEQKSNSKAQQALVCCFLATSLFFLCYFFKILLFFVSFLLTPSLL